MTYEDMDEGGAGGEMEPEIDIGKRTDPSSLTTSTNFSSGTATINITKNASGDAPTSYSVFADSNDSDPAGRNDASTRAAKRALTNVPMSTDTANTARIKGTHAYVAGETYTIEVKYGNTWYSADFTAAETTAGGDVSRNLT